MLFSPPGPDDSTNYDYENLRIQRQQEQIKAIKEA